MNNTFKIILILSIILLSVSIGLNGLSGRYKVYTEVLGGDVFIYKTDSWTGRTYATSVKLFKENDWVELKKQ